MQAPMETIGNTAAPKYYLRVSYWGGWGYKKHAVEMAAKLKDSKYGDNFQYNLFKDADVTGRFEVVLQKGPEEDSETDCMLWSKQQSGEFPMADLDTFMALVE